MILSLIYIILALLGISFLVFIHELGHYFMARRLGITIETFSIGFGKSIYEWDHKGVKWKIGILPFGGYVKMAGMEKQGPLEPYQIEGGFLAQKPGGQIKVALMGPLVNIVFAFLAFTLLWAMGGREKTFSEFTKHIGYVEADSTLYQAKVRPGDEITTIRNKPIRNFEDLIYGAVLDAQPLSIGGNQVNYNTGGKVPFTYTFPIVSKKDAVEKVYSLQNILLPADYLLYDKMPSGAENALFPGSPLIGSGIEYGDRIIWADGHRIFSKINLIQVINSPKVLLTVERAGNRFLTRVPRLKISELRLTSAEKAEFDDWREEANLATKVEELKFIPYNLSADGVVENPLGYIDEKSTSKLFYEEEERSESEIPLQQGDRIIAVQGQEIFSSYELLKELQTHKTLLIVTKLARQNPPLWTEADKGFEASFEPFDLKEITDTIGTDQPLYASGTLRLLNPVTPLPMRSLPLSPKQAQLREENLEKQKKAIEEISDPKRQAAAIRDFELYQNRLMLGLVLQDERVIYNPKPAVLFTDVFKQVYKTLFALIGGALSPKNIMGPVGIVQVIQYGWSVGAKEALYWLGMISLNLGLINLLPLPVLDGGYIVFAIWEKITKKPLKAKTRERLIFPFIVLLIAFFVYMTYNDLSRLIGRFF